MELRIESSVAASYHEQQSRMRCAQHAINNLLQRHVVTADRLNAIAVDLGGRLTLDHRWPVLGNYCLNTVMIALQQCSPPMSATFWDARKSSEVDMSELLERCRGCGAVGLIVNVQVTSWWTLKLFNGRHWYAIRMLDAPEGWILHDSNASSPQPLADGRALCELLQREMSDRDAQILIVQDTDSCSTGADLNTIRFHCRTVL